MPIIHALCLRLGFFLLDALPSLVDLLALGLDLNSLNFSMSVFKGGVPAVPLAEAEGRVLGAMMVRWAWLGELGRGNVKCGRFRRGSAGVGAGWCSKVGLYTLWFRAPALS